MIVKQVRRLVATSIAVALAAPLAHARDLEIADLLDLRNVAGVAVSPDGSHVAHLVRDQRNVLEGEKNGSGDIHLWVGPRGEAGRPFIAGEVAVRSPQWTDDGEAIAFRARRDGDDHTIVYSIPVTGGEAEPLYKHETSILGYEVSTDGARLYFTARDKTPEVVSKARKQGFNAVHYEDGLTFTHLWRVDLTADEPKAEKISSAGHFSNIALSPDGRSIAAAVAPTPSVDDSLMRRRIHVIDTASGEVRAVVETPGKLGAFSWSPSSAFIALHAGTDENDPGDGVLMVADAATGSFEQLTPDALQLVVDVDWLGNSEILATVHRGVESELVVYDRNGRERRILRTSEDVVPRYADAAGGTVAFAADSASRPASLYGLRGRGAAGLWHDPNEWMSEIDLAAQSTYTYESRDGRTVEGLLILPDGAAPAGGWPLILTVHGGPESHYSDGWLTGYSLPGQVAAARGFAVFMPNYLGSTGRGVEWAKAHQGDYAGREFNDLVDGVEALVEEGIVNRDKVGITGGSYGGYASAWGATALSEHFAASVTFVPVTNQLSASGTTDIPDEKFLVHARKRPWDGDWMNLLERSPVFHAGNSKTPTLIMHGDSDPRVHPSQSLELYRHLKLRSAAPVRLVLYPGEGHGNAQAAARHDYAHRMMRWMEHYLLGEGGEPPPFELGAEVLGLDEGE